MYLGGQKSTGRELRLCRHPAESGPAEDALGPAHTGMCLARGILAPRLRFKE